MALCPEVAHGHGDVVYPAATPPQLQGLRHNDGPHNDAPLPEPSCGGAPERRQWLLEEVISHHISSGTRKSYKSFFGKFVT